MEMGKNTVKDMFFERVTFNGKVKLYVTYKISTSYQHIIT